MAGPFTPVVDWIGGRLILIQVEADLVWGVSKSVCRGHQSCRSGADEAPHDICITTMSMVEDLMNN